MRLSSFQVRGTFTDPNDTFHHSEWGFLTFIPFIILLLVVIKGEIYMPVWTYFVALGFGAVAMLPLSAIYAISVRAFLPSARLSTASDSLATLCLTQGFGVKVGFFNELVYGCAFIPSPTAG